MTGASNNSRKKHIVNIANQVEAGAPSRLYNSPSPILWFGDDDLMGLVVPHEDAIIIAVFIFGTEVQRVLVETRISDNILFKTDYDKLVNPPKILSSVRTIVRFTGVAAEVLGEFHGIVELGT